MTAFDLGSTTDERPTRPVGGSPGYLPGLDGLRALSVLAVIAYHLELSWAPGGFLGVEVFFVVSGFLITGLLLGEIGLTGGIDTRRFWMRRARRLLPAAVTMIASVVAFSIVVPWGGLGRFRGDVVASLLYVQNWHAIVAEQPYFAAFGRPSPLRHLWSLAIEEQFYLAWPLALPVAVRALGRRRAGLAIAVVAAASVAAMAATGDIAAPDRAYYGTDTRLFGLLAGALLAFAWRPRRASADIGRAARHTIDGVGAAALLVLAWQVLTGSEYDHWMFPWGFVTTDVATVLAIVAVTHPAGSLPRHVGAGTLQAIGRRSYSIYLWHWPVIVYTRPGVDWPLAGTSAFLVRAALTAALAEASYRFIEQPVRDGRVQAWLAARRSTTRPWPRLATLTIVTVAVTSALALATTPPTSAARVEAGDSAIPILDLPPITIDLSPTTAPTTTAPPVAAPVTTLPQPQPAPTTVPSRPDSPLAVTIIGESVTLGAAPNLTAYYGPRVQIDAVESRSFSDDVAVVEAMAAAGRLTPTVIVHFGNNGAAPAGALERVVAAVGPERRLILVNVRVPMRWESQVNDEVRRVDEAHDNVFLADWYALSGAEPDVLHTDGVHLTERGRVRYTDLLVGTAP